MKKGKRVVVLVVALILILSCLFGCGGNQKGSDPESVSTGESDTEDASSTSTSISVSTDTTDPDDPNSKKTNNSPHTTTATSKGTLEGNVYVTGFPIVKKETTLRVLCTSFPLHVNGFDKMAFNTEYQKMTGVKIKWELMENNQNEKIVSTMAAGNYPDVIIPYQVLRASQVQKYGEAGAFLTLDKDTIKKWAPNAWAAIESSNIVKQAVTFDNGKIYSLPGVTSDWGHELYGSKMYINKTWLDNLNLKVPTNYRDFLKVMEAFVKQDPNGNGINDEVGLAVNGITGMLIGGPQGIEYSGENNGWMYVDAKGKLHYFFASEAYRSSMKYLNKLYNLDALDWLTFTNVKPVRETVSTGRVGCFIAANGATIIPESMLSDYIIMGPLAADSSSVPVVPTARGTEVRPYSFIITASAASNQKKEIALRWIDYFYTPEGYVFKEYGPNGYVQDVDKTGMHSLIPQTINGKVSAKYTDQDRYKVTPGYVIPGWDKGTDKIWIGLADLYDNFEMTKSAVFFRDIDTKMAISTYSKYHSKYYIPYYGIRLTEQEEYQASQFTTTLHKYAKGQINVYVSGTQDIDNHWSTYQAELERYGLSKAEKLFQTAYDRCK